MDFYALTQQCASQIEPQVMAGLVHIESNFNPYAIGVVGGSVRQPRSQTEAINTVRQLRAAGKDFSVGLSQVNQTNFRAYGLNESNMFNPCSNISAGASILRKCLNQANAKYGNAHSSDGKLRLALSCYYSGNFQTGFTQDFSNQSPYVVKVYNKIMNYRNGGRTLAPPAINPMVTPYQVVNNVNTAPQNANMNVQPVFHDSNTGEYANILTAIQAQKVKAKEAEQEEKSTPAIEVVAATNAKPTFTGDLFASPANDLFRKQGL